MGQSIPPGASETSAIRPLGLINGPVDYVEGIDGKHANTFDGRKNLSKRTISMDIKAKEYGWAGGD